MNPKHFEYIYLNNRTGPDLIITEWWVKSLE